jgi:hypothetical protein
LLSVPRQKVVGQVLRVKNGFQWGTYL